MAKKKGPVRRAISAVSEAIGGAVENLKEMAGAKPAPAPKKKAAKKKAAKAPAAKPAAPKAAAKKAPAVKAPAVKAAAPMPMKKKKKAGKK